GVGNLPCAGIALHGIDIRRNTKRAQQIRAFYTRSDNHGGAGDFTVLDANGVYRLSIDAEPGDLLPEQGADAQPAPGMIERTTGEQAAIAGRIERAFQATDKPVPYSGKRRIERDQFLSVEGRQRFPIVR